MEVKKIMKYKGKVVLVASPPNDPQGNCPRLIINKGNAVIRDDYHGRLSLKSSIIKRLF